MSKFIFLVVGSSGEYSDRRDWYVAAYRDRALAEQHERAADIRAKELERARCPHDEKLTSWCETCDPNYEHQTGNEAVRGFMGALDPDARWDYTGMTYFTVEVPLRAVVPHPTRIGLRREGGPPEGQWEERKP